MREFFQNNVSMASAQIASLAAYSTSDAVRLNASKYIVEAAFRAAEMENDPIAKLFDELKANDPDTAAAIVESARN
jgi:recombinational DNA repair protein (RecF pathway)